MNRGRMPGSAGHTFTTLDEEARRAVIMSAATITTHAFSVVLMGSQEVDVVPLFVRPGYDLDYIIATLRDPSFITIRKPELVWAEVGFSSSMGNPIVAGNATISTPVVGSALYAGLAGGYYVSSHRSGGFVSTIELQVDFKVAGPEVTGSLDYDFGGVAGNLVLSGGQWDPVKARFRNGDLACGTGCVSVGDVAAWSANFIEVSGVASTSLDVVEGMTGKFGLVSLDHGGEVFDAMGIFAAVTDTTAYPLPAKASYFPAKVTDLLLGSVHASAHLNRLAEYTNLYHRRQLLDQMRNTILEPSIPGHRVQPTVVKFGDNFVGTGGTLQLATESWDWRTGDHGNCYCTMFLTGNVFDSNGFELPMGLSASPTLMSRTVDYGDAKYGWVGGLWRRDNSPDSWQKLGDGGMGIFVDGTAPATLPTSGRQTYVGRAVGVWSHSNYTMDVGYNYFDSDLTLNVHWTPARPVVYGELQIPFQDPVSIILIVADWSAHEMKLINGSLRCDGLCLLGIDAEQTWGGMFVETGKSDSYPGGFAGGFSFKDLIYAGVSPVDFIEVFGWLWAQPIENLYDQNHFLNLPGQSAVKAYKEGLSAKWASITAERRESAVTVDVTPGISDPRYNKIYGLKRWGHPGTESSFLHTGFWEETNPQKTFSMGVAHEANSVSVPTSGEAVYQGNAAGIFASAAGDHGVFEGDVSLYLQFASDGFSAGGQLNLVLGEARGSFDMSMEGNVPHFVSQGELTCLPETCDGGTGKWTGSPWHTDGELAVGSTPDAFFGQVKLHGVSIGNTTYDALGMFAAVTD